VGKSLPVLILAGGFGTRLNKISKGTPKALMPIGHGFYLDLLLEKLVNYNIGHIYLSLYYKSELFQNYVQHSIYANKLTTIIEPEPLGTGGAVNYVIENSSISSPFYVINGDSISDINIDKMYIEFEKSQYKAMVGISEVKDAERYGTVIMENGIVVSFNEKGINKRGWINNGHYILIKEVFEGFTGVFSLEKDVFPKMIENLELGAFKVENDHFIDMGIPKDYNKLCNIFEVNNDGI
jgi:D-glycero-alpha-D-manno-heptose 1-phosphate guanylyltransferase